MADESDHPVGGGLITQRMQAERGRTVAIMMICLGVAWMVVAALFAFDSPRQDVWDWVRLVLTAGAGILAIVYGVFALRERVKRIASFNAEHGEDAGRQPTL